MVTSPALRPSEYTAALIQVLLGHMAAVAGAAVLEIGSGSGVVLGAAGALGAKSLCGVDIEPEAVAAGESLLSELGHGPYAEMHRGDMWEPVSDRRFDLVVANLPHFPMEPLAFSNRRPTWSAGGSDGRRFLDPFLDKLASHLAPGGRAFLTHNAFVSPDVSRATAARHGLEMRVASTVLVYIPEEKLAHMTPSILHAAVGRSIHCFGDHAFGEVHILEIAEPAAFS